MKSKINTEMLVNIINKVKKAEKLIMQQKFFRQ